uniref:Uncharacterized protein n=2 Tax=Chaetoceros debilis TaxID=122233 RepID=A0A7S3Q7G3_9STRA|eukprot:CAMPEP_0194078332 /NCGR_PEP_ID=MMETSP0149-20130528/4758_1 /TAXON_ID=122233 /ORGANISM="Chaetoceros debilis, Strain MM31A-1" /LENGTH=600 /DNA_ID=CAMNT_0038759571 /DNA_START=34 /DNA_END=1836 /DNA_ORIENTATION=+
MGILVTRDGSITLPCALLLMGIPLWAIGKHHTSSASASASAPTTTFHYTLGVGMIFLSLALIVFESTIASKWTGMGDGVYVDDKHNGRKVDTRTREEMDDDEETELIARHLDSSKILESIQMTCSEISQNRLKKKSSHRMNLRKTIKSSNTSIDKKKADDGTEIQMVSMKQRRNVVVYLNALAMKLSRHRQSHHHNHNRTTQNDGNDNVNVNPDEIYLICQEAAFKTLIAFQSIDIDTDIDGDANTDDSISSKNMNMDAIYSAAIALLALTAKNPSVQHRSISNPDVYGIQIVIDIMVHSLKRAKADANSNSNDNSNNNNNKNRSGEKKNYERVEKESIAAELQRKACLYLGAISDGNSAMAHAIGVGSESGSKKSSMGGLEAILQSMLWFRYHGEVINWALWALFILCYDESGTEDDKTSTKSSGKNGEHGNGDNMNVGKTNQNLLVRMDGIDKICTVMRNILHDLQKDNDDDSGDCNADDNDLRKAAATRSARMAQKENAKEVSRHGLSLLFDILRQRQNFENIPTYMRNKYDNDAELDAMHIRRIALNAGLHDVLKHAMVECSDVSDIMMMGQQMLICTGYKGDVPCFDGKMVPFSK